jgi:hypothetical protein
MAAEAPLTFVHDDDAVLWAVAKTADTDGWLVVRTDTDRPEVEVLETYNCLAAHWHLSGHKGWVLAAGLSEYRTWHVYLPGQPAPWTVELKGAYRDLIAPAYPDDDDDPAAEGLRLQVAPRDLAESISWCLAAELARRHPEQLWIAHTVPITGTTYDCLTLWRPGDRGAVGPPIFQLNRGGSIHVHHRFDGTPISDWPRWSWYDYLFADPYQFLLQLETAAGLPTIRKVPSTTPKTLVWRIIAQLVASSPRSVHMIDAVPGYADVSGFEGINNDMFDAFPGARRAAATAHPDDPLDCPHRRFWFICVDGTPRVALATTGHAWMLGSIELDLMDEYDQADRRLGPVIAQLLQDIID